MRYENDPQWNLIRRLLSLMLVLLILLGLAVPGITLERQEPERPDVPVQDVTVLQVGEELLQDSSIRIPSQERTPETDIETLPPETEGAMGPTEEQNQPTEPQSEPEPTEEIPVTQPGGENEDAGNDDGAQGDLTGDATELELSMVLTWYPYGKTQEQISCQSMATQAKTINVAKLTNGNFRYRFAPAGTDADRIRSYSVSYQQGNGLFQTVDAEGELTISSPDSGQSRVDTFQISATIRSETGDADQKLTFTFTIRWENKPDLELRLRWKKNGEWKEISGASGTTIAFTVNREELADGHFQYEADLSGELKENSKITHLTVTTEDGDGENWNPQRDLKTLKTSSNRDSQIYYLKFTVESPAGELNVTFKLTYREEPDVKLKFLWWGKSNTKQTLIVPAGEGGKTLELRSNQLSAGAINYELTLTGDNAKAATILTATYSKEPMVNQGEKGNLPMDLPTGETEAVYTLSVTVLVGNRTLHYRISFRVTRDVTLQMTYVADGQTYLLICENGDTVYPQEEIYDDQLTDGQLAYQMELLGSDSAGMAITSVVLYQEEDGIGTSRRLTESGEAQLRLNGGRQGNNVFTVTAEADQDCYTFKFVLPYKHRGGDGVSIEINLKNGQTVINETQTNLTVIAYSLNANGERVYITPDGTNTKLIVTLDGEEVPHLGSEYALYPKNPEVGDSNVHKLVIYAEDAYGESKRVELELNGQRQQIGQAAGTAYLYVDMTVLGIEPIGPIAYEVLAGEPISYAVVKAIMGEDTGDPFGASKESLGWSGRYAGTLDIGFYLQSLNTGMMPNTLEDSVWPGATEAEILAAIDARFGTKTGLATLWRCIYRNGLNKSSGSGGTVGEFSYTSGSGWLYAIGNDTYYPGQSMSELELKDGDILTLRFSLAYGWDVGGGTEGYGNTAGYCVTARNGTWSINHVMEEVADENGTIHLVCHCCGLEEDCLHQNRFWQDQGNSTHMEYCPDCQSLLGDPVYHVWNPDTGDTENHQCTVCGSKEVHFWRELPGSTATCTESGVANFECDICGAIREEIVQPKGHTLGNQWNYDQQAHYQVCSTCHEEFNRGSHDYVYAEEWEDFLCVHCGILHEWDAGCSAQKTILSATCQQIRYLCSGCGMELVQNGIFEEYHSYDENGICRYCGQDDPTVHIHDYVCMDEVPADCEMDGYRSYLCACGEGYTDILPAVGHTWSDWETIREPTGDEEGMQCRYCENCEKEEEMALPLVQSLRVAEKCCNVSDFDSVRRRKI